MAGILPPLARHISAVKRRLIVIGIALLGSFVLTFAYAPDMVAWLKRPFHDDLIFYGPTEALFSNPQHRYTQALLAAMPRVDQQAHTKLQTIPGAPPDIYQRFEVGITASNLEKSRAFYRSFVGLEELPPVVDPALGATKYPFRHGDTTINVWSFGGTLPANKSSAGIQYVISNVETVDAKAKAQSVTIDRPLGLFGQGLRTIWLSDPDGVTNYFAQILPRRPAAAPSTQ